MTYQPRILAFGGSLRKDSFNKKLAKVAAAAAERAGADVTVVDLREFPMPVYDGDLETANGLPANTKKLKELMKAQDGFLIASPEFNSSVSGSLKNVIDWVSRPEPDEPRLAAFSGKIAGIMSASPGALGGLRGLFHLRSILMNINVLVLPNQMAIPSAAEAFGPDGSLKDSSQQEAIEGIAGHVVETIRKLKS